MMREILPVLALSFGLQSQASAADGFTPDQLLRATQEALKSFKADKPTHLAHITGFKTWRSGADAKVKIYVTHDGMTMDANYLCLAQGDTIHCSEQ